MPVRPPQTATYFCSVNRPANRPLLGSFVMLPLLAAMLPLAVPSNGWTAQPGAVYLGANHPAASQKKSVIAGELEMRTRAGAEAPAPIRLGTDISVQVAGPIARISVTQAFRNTAPDWVEATYLFPMPEDSAVDSLKMVVGDRIIIGEIQPRQQARETYEQAKSEGKTASLMEQQRPNMFTTQVANIGPGETILISIEYQVAVDQRTEGYGLKLPLVVAPRYVPPDTLLDHTSDQDQDNSPILSPEALSDALAITAPVAPEGSAQDRAKLSISIDLAPGFELAQVSSPTHSIEQTNETNSQHAGETDHRIITFRDVEGAGNRDFELLWTSASKRAATALFQQTWEGAHYVMAVVSPPAPDALPQPPARDLIFVIDNSGSMGGESMDQAKASLAMALRSLSPQDQFNIIRFDDTLTQLHRQPVPATPENISAALAFTESLEAEGGTEMVPALQQALNDRTPVSSRLRQVIFLTDGAISNEAEMLGVLGRDRGRSKVFMVGIGSAPNAYLMDRMAQVGRGSYVAIPDVSLVQERMQVMLNRLVRPALTDVRLISTSQGITITPRVQGDMASPVRMGHPGTVHHLPDLYAGEPLVVMGVTDQMAGTFIIQGRIGDTPWTETLSLADASDATGIAKQWARGHISDLAIKAILGEISYETARMETAATGVTFGLVTSETSLVAVDHTPRRPDGIPLRREDLPLPLPKGWDFDSLFGQSADAAPTPAAMPTRSAAPAPLPQTGTLSTLLTLAGLGLVLLGGLGLWVGRTGRRADPKPTQQP